MICLDLNRECLTRTSDKNYHDFKRHMASNFLWDFYHESTVKFTKSDFPVKTPLLFKLHIRWSGSIVNLKEQFDNTSYRLTLLIFQLSNLKATVTHQKCTIISNFDFDPLRVELGPYETNSKNNCHVRN